MRALMVVVVVVSGAQCIGLTTSTCCGPWLLQG
jgi:hypothetical protein